MAKSILIVDDSVDLLDSFSSALELLVNARTLTAAGLAELQEKKDAALACELAILDINLGPEQPSGIDVYRWLKEAGFAGKIVFFTGHGKDHPFVRQALGIGDVRIFEKPLAVDRLLEMVSGA